MDSYQLFLPYGKNHGTLGRFLAVHKDLNQGAEFTNPTLAKRRFSVISECPSAFTRWLLATRPLHQETMLHPAEASAKEAQLL
jgi:hypothetical protein